ncbi:hypothetical protein ES708_13399 [subsurface metagenome]
MKKILFPILALVLAIGLAIPMAIPAAASPATVTVVSDDSGATVITTVYNKTGGANNTVDLSGSPLTAVRAWEPKTYPFIYPTEPLETTNSVWDNGVNWFEDNASSADWIWETHRAEDPASYAITDPLYDADASRYGRVVLFETTFNIPGNPTSATLHIAADNGYEAWVNSGTHYLSSTVVGGPGWETSNLWQTNLSTSGWQGYGTFVISGSDLVNGVNTLYVLAGNEYFWGDDGNSPIPPTQSNPYFQYNPGAVIFQLDVEYEEGPGIEVDKDYRYTNVCFEKDNDGDGLFSEDPIDGIDNDLDGLVDEDDVDCPSGTNLGYLLPMSAEGNYTLEAVIHPKNNKVRSYNPGQYYAVSTVNVLVDVDELIIVEDWSACTDPPISVLNPKKGGGSVVIVQVGPGDDVAYQILNATSDAVTITGNTATAVLDNPDVRQVRARTEGRDLGRHSWAMHQL